MKSASRGAGALIALATMTAASAEPSQRRWDGVYVGVSGGGGAGAFDTKLLDDIGLLPPGSVVAQDQSGMVGGVHAGFNATRGPWLLGIETGFGWTSIGGSGSRISTVDPDWTVHTKGETNWIASAVARLGFTSGNTLIYAKGGIAMTDMTLHGYSTMLGTYAGGGKIDRRFTGWTIGAGSEMAFTGRWSIRLDYDYFDFGKERPNIGGTDIALTTQHHVGRVGISYALGGLR